MRAAIAAAPQPSSPLLLLAQDKHWTAQLSNLPACSRPHPHGLLGPALPGDRGPSLPNIPARPARAHSQPAGPARPHLPLPSSSCAADRRDPLVIPFLPWSPLASSALTEAEHRHMGRIPGRLGPLSAVRLAHLPRGRTDWLPRRRTAVPGTPFSLALAWRATATTINDATTCHPCPLPVEPRSANLGAPKRPRSRRGPRTLAQPR